MMWGSATMFVLAAVLCWVVPGPDAQEAASCGYADCIFQTYPTRWSGVEIFALKLNFSLVPGDMSKQCREMLYLLNKCRSLRTGCPTTVTHPWADRLYDDRYLVYLMDLGQYSCEHYNEVVNLRTCVTRQTDVAMQTCLGSNGNVDTDCVLEQFNAHSNCPENIRNFIAKVVDYLDDNPYIANVAKYLDDNPYIAILVYYLDDNP